jgi:hypothetical protein
MFEKLYVLNNLSMISIYFVKNEHYPQNLSTYLFSAKKGNLG